MTDLVRRLYGQIVQIPLIDPHSHIAPSRPVAATLNDILAYHYYTELAHSAGLPKSQIEESSGLDQSRRIIAALAHCANTAQCHWLVELCQTFFGFDGDEITVENIESVDALARKTLGQPDWEDQVFAKTNLEAIFLTNDFDDPLEGFDVRRYVPCLRTDDLVFKLDDPTVRKRFEASTGKPPTTWESVAAGLDRLFERFVSRGARACAISLPPDFAPERPGLEATRAALASVVRGSGSSGERRLLANAIFYALADRCEEFSLPFDLMIGVWRNVYEAGVHQGRDLFDKTTSLYQFRRLFNEKPRVTFPISVLTHNQNQELVSYAWIFPNVVASGHWWYSNVPAFIEPDVRARLDAAPISKQIGYYSDAYKLEFVLPKYNMYRRCLANVLAQDFVVARQWSEERAIALARTILRDNVERIFPERR